MRNVESFSSGVGNERKEESPDRNIERIFSLEVAPRPRMEDFDDLYRAEEIERDRRYVETILERFRKFGDPEDSVEAKRGEALEIIIADQIDLGGSIVRTTKYDDIANGIDAVMEIEAEEDGNENGEVRRIMLGVDTSTSADLNCIRRKIERNAADLLDPDSRREVKYFASDLTGFRGRLSPVVPVVLGVAGEHANELFRDFIALDEARTRGDKERAKRFQQRIGNHPIQQVLLQEILLQLDLYSSLALPNEQVGREIGRSRTTLRELIKERRERGICAEDLGRDRTLDIIEKVVYGTLRSSS